MRLFLATTFPAPATAPLNARVSQIRSRLPPASWVRPEAQHLTLAFLGEQPEALLESLVPIVAGHVGRVPKFDAHLEGCGFFPNARRARVGWVGVDPEANFNQLAEAVRDAVKRAGVALDSENFKSHLTLMRIRDWWPPASIELFERTLKPFRSEAFTVDRVTLYSSKLNPNGAIHTPLREFALG